VCDQDQLSRLSQIKARASANGVDDLSELSAAEAQAFEPQLACTGALLSPSTGIVDSHAFMVSLLGDAENHGAVLVTRTRVVSIHYRCEGAGYALQTLQAGAERVGATGSAEQIGTTKAGNSVREVDDTQNLVTLTAKYVVNAAGHGACELANSQQSSSQSGSQNGSMEKVMFKGNYFSLAAPSPFSRLVYPVPEEAGLGVHLTIDLAGRARFGPDVESVASEDYEVDPQRAQGFYAAIRRYWPALPDDSLLPDYSGIRPRVRVDGELYSDFLIQGSLQHGLPGLVNLLGIESPGLTASLAIADNVAQMLGQADTGIHHADTGHEPRGLVHADHVVSAVGWFVLFCRHRSKGADTAKHRIHPLESCSADAMVCGVGVEGATTCNAQSVACTAHNGGSEQRHPVFIDRLGAVAYRVRPCLYLQRHDAAFYRSGCWCVAG